MITMQQEKARSFLLIRFIRTLINRRWASNSWSPLSNFLKLNSTLLSSGRLSVQTVSRRHNSSVYPQSLNGTAALFFRELLLETREKSLIVLSTRGRPFLRSACFNGRSTGRQFNLLAWWTLHSLECSLFAHFPIVRKPTRNKYESFGGDTSGISTSRRRKQHKKVRKGKKKEHQQKQKKNGRWKPQTSLPFSTSFLFFSQLKT